MLRLVFGSFSYNKWTNNNSAMDKLTRGLLSQVRASAKTWVVLILQSTSIKTNFDPLDPFWASIKNLDNVNTKVFHDLAVSWLTFDAKHRCNIWFCPQWVETSFMIWASSWCFVIYWLVDGRITDRVQYFHNKIAKIVEQWAVEPEAPGLKPAIGNFIRDMLQCVISKCGILNPSTHGCQFCG